MLTRFKQNIRTYPRTAAVVGCIYLGAIISGFTVGHYMHITSTRQILTLVALVLLIALVDGLTYRWIMSDNQRVGAVLGMLNSFEGRDDDSSDESCSCRDIYTDEDGQDVAEYAVMLAVMLVIVLATIHAIGAHAATTLASVGSKIQ